MSDCSPVLRERELGNTTQNVYYNIITLLIHYILSSIKDRHNEYYYTASHMYAICIIAVFRTLYCLYIWQITDVCFVRYECSYILQVNTTTINTHTDARALIYTIGFLKRHDAVLAYSYSVIRNTPYATSAYYFYWSYTYWLVRPSWDRLVLPYYWKWSILNEWLSCDYMSSVREEPFMHRITLCWFRQNGKGRLWCVYIWTPLRYKPMS